MQSLWSKGFALLTVACLTGCATEEADTKANPASVDSTIDQSQVTSTTQEPTSALGTVPPGFESISTTDGRVRSYQVSDLSNGELAPLLFVLHGFGGTASFIKSYSRVEDELQRLGNVNAVVVYPNGSGAEAGLPQSWNAGNCCPFAIYEPVDDVAFFDALITKLGKQYNIDPQRVWVLGHSNGGMMAYRLACELSDKVSAIGVAAGALMVDTCTPTRPVSALHVHGEADLVVPLAGGVTAGLEFPSAQTSIQRFAESQSCSVKSSITTCPNGATVELVTNRSWPHDWQPEWTALFADFLATQ
jgi:poly(3-hydroxybutyrate) depolymerase